MHGQAAPIPRRRPTARATLVTVDDGLIQAQCVCRWRGRRWRDPMQASAEGIRHVESCGLCVSHGRDYMDKCSCANCHRRRVFTRQIREP